MAEFHSQREAKEYLIGKIVAEAEREGKPLSEIERKMLYFSETDWTLPDIRDVNAAFERACDEDQYEQKIASLARVIEAQVAGADKRETDTWYAAIEKLNEGDHYLLVLLNTASVPAAKSARPRGDLLKLWLTALAIAFGFFAFLALGNWMFGAKFFDALDWLFGRH
jgi:hypothetical protein